MFRTVLIGLSCGMFGGSVASLLVLRVMEVKPPETHRALVRYHRAAAIVCLLVVIGLFL